MLTKPPRKPGFCDVSGEELVHRKDDNEDTVRNRMEVFKDNIDPVLEYYESADRLIRVDASLSSDEVYTQLLKII